LVSNASIQKYVQSRFAWVIAHESTPLWSGLGLLPSLAEDMYFGHAEAFGLFVVITFFAYKSLLLSQPVLVLEIQCFCKTSMQTSSIIMPNDTTANNHNIFLAIADAANKCSPLTFQHLHVKGQDANQQCPLTIAE